MFESLSRNEKIGLAIAAVVLLALLGRRMFGGAGASGGVDVAGAYKGAADLASVQAGAENQGAQTRATATLQAYQLESERLANQENYDLALAQSHSDADLESRRIDAYVSAAHDVTEAEVTAAHYQTDSELQLEKLRSDAALEEARLNAAATATATQAQVQQNADLLALQRYQLDQQARDAASARSHETSQNILSQIGSIGSSILGAIFHPSQSTNIPTFPVGTIYAGSGSHGGITIGTAGKV